MKPAMPNRFELFLFVSTFAIYVALSVWNVINQKDINYIYFSIVIFCFVLVLNYIASSLISFIPYIPREICSIYFFGVAIAFPGATPLLLPIMSALLFLYWSWLLINRTSSKYSYLKWPVLSVAILSLAYIASYPILDVLNRSDFDVYVNERTLLASDDKTYPIEKFTYGSGKDNHRVAFSSEVTFRTRSIDASAELPEWSGFSGWYRTHYWGFDSKDLPVNGRVWMPVGEGPFPLVLIVHGDHAMQDYSDTGYEYLAKPLAEKGYIAVSVDNNFLNRSWSDLMLTHSLMGPGEMKTRAQLLVEHLRAWSEWNNTIQNPYFGKVDLSKVALIGHSRGGEAVAHVPHLLTNEKLTGIDVKSIIGIAPVDRQYWPNGKMNHLANVNYMVMHGSLDNEMYFAGLGQYGRTNIKSQSNLVKAAVYIDGANHGQFNSTWGQCDNEFYGPICTRLNLINLVSEAVQQEIARFTISSFLDIAIKGGSSQKFYFRNKKERDKLNYGVRTKIQFQDSNATILKDFQGDNKEENIIANNLLFESLATLEGYDVSHYLSWNHDFAEPLDKTPWVKYALPSKNISPPSALRIDLANIRSTATDFTIKIDFEDGSEMTTSLESVGLLEGGYTRSLSKFDYIFGNSWSEQAFESYFISLNTNSIPKSLTLIFNKRESGEIYVDNIGLL
ncbi:chlorophyllase/cutinase-like alpha/beta fold protein [Teredinibacter turnerae]|uniref:poly(ethylene terephthalate) hydrolase family protein n=1 Tax=Teredinibacter turnerae TaxID=2426 RepID=UPI000380A787|nr:alpha/beta hydrolase [Teredinibacter turnerae]